MQCKHCNRELNVSKAYEQNNHVVQNMVCTNSKCSNYCGRDLNNPIKIADVVRTAK